MARTEQEIYDALLDEKTATAELAGLTSVSNTAIWRLWLWIVAKAIHWHEKIFDAFRVEIDAKAAAVVPGNIPWYIRKCKEFQYGDALVFVNEAPGYLVYDESKKIVTQVAIVESTELLIKLAKGLPGALAPLTNDEKTAFEAYLNKIKFAGTHTTVLSLNADLLRIKTGGGYAANFYYNAIYKLDDIKADLDAKANNLLINMDYNGFLYANKLEDIIQSALGYHDLEITSFEATPASDINWTEIGRRYNPLSGYMQFEQPLSEMLTFIAVV